MAGIRSRAVAHFIFEGESEQSTLDTSTLGWELLTHGFTRRLLKQAARSLYYHLIRPVFADETPDQTEDKISLVAHGLMEPVYSCKLKIGEADKDENEEVAKKERERNGGWFYREDVDRPKIVPELYVKITLPRRHEVLPERMAMAYSIVDQNNVDSVKGERVHVKWSTDVNRLKSIYHEADMYDKLRRAEIKVEVTPKFYGFYENYGGDFAFGIAVYERGDKLRKASEQRKDIAILLVFSICFLLSFLQIP